MCAGQGLDAVTEMKACILIVAGLFALAFLSVSFLTNGYDTSQSTNNRNLSTDSSKSDPAKNKKETDWKMVTAISNNFLPRFTDLENIIADLRLVLEGPYTIEDARSVYAGIHNTEKAIRDLEDEMWVELSKVMAYSQLLDYQIHNSRAGRSIIENTKWFNPTKDELLCLYTAEKMRNDYLDEHFDGDLGAMNQAVVNGGTRLVRNRDLLNPPEGIDIDAYMADRDHRIYIESRFTPERYREYNDRDGTLSKIDDHDAKRPSRDLVAFEQMTLQEFEKADREWHEELSVLLGENVDPDDVDSGFFEYSYPSRVYSTNLLEEDMLEGSLK